MRILIAHNAYQQRGGEDSVVENECRLLREAGHDVDLLLVSNDVIKGIGATLKAAAEVTYSDAGRRMVADRIRAFRPDVLQVHNFFPRLTPAVYDAARDAGVPVVQTLHNFRITCASATLFRDGKICETCISSSPYQAVIHRCYRNSSAASLALSHMISVHRRRNTWARKVDRFFALTNFAKTKFIEAGVPADRIVVKPNFAPDRGERRTAGQRRGALFVGRLSAEKGIAELVAAWKGMPHPLKVIGTGPLEARLRGVAPETVTFLGAMTADRVAVEMSEAAALVVPSTCYEGFPVVVAEAFAAGLPVAVSRLGGLPEIVRDNETGRHFAYDSPAEMREAVKQLLENPEIVNKLGRNARRRYEDCFSAAAVLAILERTYQDVVAKGGARIGSPVSAGAVSEVRSASAIE